ncbi:hypothetical protein MYX06_02325 [Patescibacteria group bacterium AH-259-L05]|nr:hypothetical protein [Patescibacteria group bacterium AH-259-L05]
MTREGPCQFLFSLTKAEKCARIKIIKGGTNVSKQEKIEKLVEIIKEFRYQFYVEHLAANYATIDENLRKQFIEEYYKNVEKIENVWLARFSQSFSGMKERALDAIMSTSSSFGFKAQYLPPMVALTSAVTDTQKAIVKRGRYN